MSPAIVICIDRDTFVTALVALEQTFKRLGPDGLGGARLAAAIEDMKRAHSMYLAWDAQIHVPALLRRQAG